MIGIEPNFAQDQRPDGGRLPAQKVLDQLCADTVSLRKGAHTPVFHAELCSNLLFVEGKP